MLDAVLDCFGLLLLFGQAAWFLAKGRVEALPNEHAAVPDGADAARRRNGCPIWP
jgi:hypothetical protein